MLLNRLIDAAALRAPEATAAWCDGETLSYQQLTRRANGLARVLVATGLDRRDRVAVLLSKGLNVPVGFHGVLAAGGTLVPIDPRSPVDAVVDILRTTGATHVVSEPGKQQTVRAALHDCPEVGHVIGLEPAEDEPFRCHPWAQVSEAETDRPPDV